MNEAVLKHLILWPLYLTYMIFGALLFMELEQANEKDLVNRFIKTFEKFNATKSVSNEFMNNLYHLYQDAFAMGINPHDSSYQSKWDFAGSFYFVGTVLTTIGFGLTSPITASGQACFLIYALLGIPLNILLFNTLLDQTVHLFTWTITSINRYWQSRHAVVNFNGTPRLENIRSNWEPSTAHIALTCFVAVIIVVLLSAPLFVFLEDWSFFQSVYFSVVAFTTVGFGDFVPGGVHTKHGNNLTPHYKVGNWFIIIIGTVFMYTSLALLASVYKHCLEKVIAICGKKMKRTSGLNRITATPVQASPTPARERAPSISPMRDERKRDVAARALKNWRSVKKQSIGPLNQVEASLSKRRRTSNEDGMSQTAEAILSLRGLSDNQSSLDAKLNGHTNIEELNLLEVRLTKEFNQIVEQIHQKRENIAKNTIANGGYGIDNGVISSPESICTPQFTSKTDVDETSIASNNSYS